VSAIIFAEIHKLVFETSGLQKLIRHRMTHTHDQVHNQPPLYSWRLKIGIHNVHRHVFWFE